ncbi:MAG: hypothetical protein PHX08_16960 [Lachnospiraceae bacterium]|nr:hypothetical protein [Lachnospiraceae bacterium]
MKKYIIVHPYQYGEMTVKDPDTNKEYTLTQRKVVFNEDTYSITRFIAVENVDMYTVPEKDFYIYVISYMPDGYSSVAFITDEKAVKDIIVNNLELFLHGAANEIIKEMK